MVTTHSFYTTKDFLAYPVLIEAETMKGIGIHVNGLIDRTTKESLLRVVTAMQTSGYSLEGTKKYFINVVPVTREYKGAQMDLAIAAAFIATREPELYPKCNDFLLAGELALDGELRPIRKPLDALKVAKTQGLKGVILPLNNKTEISPEEKLQVLFAENLKQAMQFLQEPVKL